MRYTANERGNERDWNPPRPPATPATRAGITAASIIAATATTSRPLLRGAVAGVLLPIEVCLGLIIFMCRVSCTGRDERLSPQYVDDFAAAAAAVAATPASRLRHTESQGAYSIEASALSFS
jgi:hypothetical protein